MTCSCFDGSLSASLTSDLTYFPWNAHKFTINQNRKSYGSINGIIKSFLRAYNSLFTPFNIEYEMCRGVSVLGIEPSSSRDVEGYSTRVY